MGTPTAGRRATARQEVESERRGVNDSFPPNGGVRPEPAGLHNDRDRVLFFSPWRGRPECGSHGYQGRTGATMTMNEVVEAGSILDTLLSHPDFKEGLIWRRRHLAANTTVFSEGDRGREVYLIATGTVRVLGNVDLDAKRQIRPGFSDLGAGEVFGELALFDNQPRSATVSTVTACDLIVINGDRLMGFLDDHPDLGYPLFKELILILVGRLRRADRKIFALFAWGLKAQGIDRYL